MTETCPRCGEPTFELYPIRVAHNRVEELCAECEREILDDGMIGEDHADE